MKRLDLKLSLLLILAFILLSWITRTGSMYYVPTTLDDFFMPGSQPLESGTFNSSDQCANCHGDYDMAVEPSYNYKGSMMSHSMHDPLFEASLTIANQDALFSGDLCIRCHTPSGWLEGRSTPTDGSALTSNDREGIQCHFCHKLVDPLSTRSEDLAYINTLPAEHIPTQYGNGMYVVDSDDLTRRGPYDDANANHPTLYSPFHSSSELCATCHDVSNPAFSKAPDGSYQPNATGMPAPSFDKYELFPVERTYSEWKMSAYNTPEGIPSDVFGGTKANVSTCIDCHMAQTTGKGCNKQFAPTRNNLAIHDLTGGNTFVPLLIKDKFFGVVDANAIDSGILRAQYMLQHAATLNLNVVAAVNGYDVDVEIINETGHKLPSGYPEGRRMWINVEAYDIADNLVYESGAYDEATGELNQNGTKIYESKLGLSEDVAALANLNGTGVYAAGESFHFALNNVVVKDNRIPPRGFTNSNFEAVQAAPVGYSYPDGAYSDITSYTVPETTYRIEVKLLYQTASKEYIEFLRDQNVTDTKGQELYDLWIAHGKSKPEVMQEAEFYTSALSLANDQTMDKAIRLYPNPANHTVNVLFNFTSGKKIKLDLYSINGIKLRSVINNKAVMANDKIQFETSNLPGGIYILKFQVNQKVTSKLLVIK
ncbi:T9SS type A sorting domain-containing protein [Aestuariivivens sediminis]|uniref:T9SS type A sorting domain-containing protein n=1 Tax=Aestuariivivens sediminis TaxID=2913557 RepID=UPI001F57312F|nr:T9SS type A sorting domain-containing protein [Aestuariivivens sediminis]